jgi:hypothetical protein
MTPLPDADIRASCTAAGVILEQFEEGTVRITLNRPCEWQSKGIASADIRGESGPFVLIGRESSPTLRHVRHRQSKTRFPVLVSHRAALIEDADELSQTLDTLAQVGWCVDNDAYVFPSDGRWIVYVGHDAGIVQYTPRRA